ncbi:hypothetical protein [Sinorhizobium fredii]|uniref:hypothetical protein n=1 Tax=Rhizobium fredii TaxID=380 RepID=UPI001181A461
MHSKTPQARPTRSEEDRREFLKKCGRFAAITPPLVTMLLSTSLTSDAIAKSGADNRDGSGRDRPRRDRRARRVDQGRSADVAREGHGDFR